MNRIAVKIAYMGKGFYGSQRQPGLRTVESEITKAIEDVCNTSIEDLFLRFASRTDRGVNAIGNVIAFYTDFKDPVALLKALNAVSWGVFYHSYALVPNDFKIRAAHSRTYRYIMPAEGIDVDLARSCASLFVGEHDFSSFCKDDGRPTSGLIRKSDITEDGNFLIYECSGRAFLWNQVRRMASAIMAVGRGEADNEDVLKALEGEDKCFGLARADGLTLKDIEYKDTEFKVPEKTVFNKRMREELYLNKIRDSFFNSILNVR